MAEGSLKADRRLFTAARDGRARDVIRLLAAGADPNARFPNGRGDEESALHAACFWLACESVAPLLAAGADPNAPTAQGQTPLALALAELEDRDPDGASLEIAGELLAAGARVEPESPLAAAFLTRLVAGRVAGGRDPLPLARALLAAGASANGVRTRGSPVSPLSAAVAAGNRKAAELLLAHGADVNAGGSAAPLAIAAGRGEEPFVERLLAAGALADPDKESFSVTPLAAAIEGGHIAVAERLLEAGADPSRPGCAGAGKEDCTPFAAAARQGADDLCRTLVARGARIPWSAFPEIVPLGRIDVLTLAVGAADTLRSPEGMPLAELVAWEFPAGGVVAALQSLRSVCGEGDRIAALRGVAGRGLESAVSLLVAEGVDPNGMLADGRTVLGALAAEGSAVGAALLLRHGADPNRRSRDGKTPLFHAVHKRQAEAAKTLLAAGADRDAKVDGEDARTYAIARLLSSRRASDRNAWRKVAEALRPERQEGSSEG